MSELVGLERGYRRLLACYPQPFRREQEDEVLAVLMAGARQGQRRPGLAEAADVLKSALRMRLRRAGWGPGKGPWGDGLALFSLAAPLLLLAAAALEVALPYRPQTPMVARVFGSNFQIGGLSLFHFSGFGIAVAGLVVIAALVLLGLRWLALAAVAGSAVYWYLASYWIPEPLQVLTTSVFMLEAAALIASPGPRRGRALMTWGQGAVLLVAAAAVQLSTLLYDASGLLAGVLTRGSSPAPVYLAVSIVLAVTAACLAVALKMNRYFLLLLAVMFYPYVMELAFRGGGSEGDLIGHPTPAHLAVLYLPPLLAACAVLLTAATPLRSRVAGSADPDKPRLT